MVAYILFGLMIMFFPPDFALAYNVWARVTFSLLVIAYGIFRGYRAIKIYKLNSNEQNK